MGDPESRFRRSQHLWRKAFDAGLGEQLRGGTRTAFEGVAEPGFRFGQGCGIGGAIGFGFGGCVLHDGIGGVSYWFFFPLDDTIGGEDFEG